MWYSGSVYAINCTVHLHPSLATTDNNGLIVDTVWLKDGEEVSNLVNAAVTENNTLTSQSQLQFNPLRWKMDDANYSCRVNVSTELQSPYILPVTGVESGNITVKAKGMHMC